MVAAYVVLLAGALVALAWTITRLPTRTTGPSSPAGGAPLTGVRRDRAGLVLIALLALTAVARLGVFPPWAAVAGADGPAWVGDTFASVDHPLHVSRAELLRTSLLDGFVPRWLPDHQGGYPAEFYPLGLAWLDVAVWVLSFGWLPIEGAHTITIAMVLIAPALPFLLLARQDRLPPMVAALAFAAHLLTAGGELQGGYTELVQMGLASNVAAAVASLLWLALAGSYLDGGRGVYAAAAAASAAFALYCNPRASFGLIALGATLFVSRRRTAASAPSPHPWRRWLVLAVVPLLLAAPELVSLARFRDLYYFIRFSIYDTPAVFGQASLQSASLPAVVLAIAAVGAVWHWPQLIASHAAALGLVAYLALTGLLNSPLGQQLVPQLEAVRLMPLQRLLTIYLAAVMLYLLLARLPSLPPWPRLNPTRVASASLLVVALAAAMRPAWLGVPEEQQSLYAVERSTEPVMIDFAAAIGEADRLAPPGTAILVLGSALSNHQPLWAPRFAPHRRFFYDEWIWYWHDRHYGAFDPRSQMFYPWNGSTLRRDYLDRHAIGAIVATGDVRATATLSPLLRAVPRGDAATYDVFEVRQPSRLVSWPGDEAIEADLAGEVIRATGRSSGGSALVRHNWHPRWQARVNGVATPVTRRGDGYMELPVPRGDVSLELRYARDWLDRGALLAATLGLMMAYWSMRRRDPSRPSFSSS